VIDATPLLRLYARQRLRRLARQRPAETQERQLLRLVRQAEGTRFGRDHGFARILSVRDFQERVPLRRYEDFWAEYWQPAFPRLTDITWPGTISYFAATSGTTTGRTKYIPVSRAMARANTFAAFDLLVHHLANRPESRVLGGKSFMLGGSTDLREEAPGIYSGDLSGIATREVPGCAGLAARLDLPAARPSTAVRLGAEGRGDGAPLGGRGHSRAGRHGELVAAVP
jgi:hypothetical protein